MEVCYNSAMFTELIENETTQKHRAEAGAAGLVLLGASQKGAMYRNYQFNECGHTRDARPEAVRVGQVRCKQCFDDRLTNDAKIYGLALIGDGRSINYKKYKLPCRHEKDITTQNAQKGAFRCQQCLDKILENDAYATGLTLIGSSTKGCNYRKYKLPCGHQTDITKSSVRKGITPTCLECGDNHFTKQSHLYIVEFTTKSGKSSIKLGIANNMNTRELSWLLREGVTTKILALWLCHSKLDLLKIEKHIHSKSGIQGLSPEEGKEFVGSGYSEFYPTSETEALIQAASDPKHGLLRLQ